MPKRKNTSASTSRTRDSPAGGSASKRQKLSTAQNVKASKQQKNKVREELDQRDAILIDDALDQTFNNDKYASFIKPLRDITKSFDYDLSDALTQLSDDILSMSQSNLPVNFSEAAIILQGCCNIYSKKVDHLYNLAYSLSKQISEAANKQREAREKAEAEAEVENDTNESSSDEDNDTASDVEGESSVALAKVKKKVVSAEIKYKEAVFMSKTPKFHEEFLPLPFEEVTGPSTMLKDGNTEDTEEATTQNDESRRALDVFFQDNNNITCNYSVYDRREEIIGKRSDFYSQTSWIECQVLFLSQIDVPDKLVHSQLAINTGHADPFGDFNLERPIRVLTPGSYHSCINSAASPAYSGAMSHEGIAARPENLELGITSPAGSVGDLSVRGVEASTPFSVTPENEQSYQVVFDRIKKEFPNNDSESVASNSQRMHESQGAISIKTEPMTDGDNINDFSRTSGVHSLNGTRTSVSSPVFERTQDPDFLRTPLALNAQNGADDIMNLSDDSIEPEIVKPRDTETGTEVNAATSSDNLSPGSSGNIRDENSNIISNIKNKQSVSQALSAFADCVEQSQLNNEEDNKTFHTANKETMNLIRVITHSRYPESDFLMEGPSSFGSSVAKEKDNKGQSSKFISASGELHATPVRTSSRIRKQQLEKIEWPEQLFVEGSPRKKERLDGASQTEEEKLNRLEANLHENSMFDHGTGRFLSDTDSSQPLRTQEGNEINEEWEKFSDVSHGCFPSNRKDDQKVAFENPHTVDMDLERPLTPLDISPMHILDSPVERFPTPEQSPEQLSCSPIPDAGHDQEQIDDQFQNMQSSSSDGQNMSFDAGSSIHNEPHSDSQVSLFSKWEDKLMPILKSQEQRPKFDIAQTSRKIVQNLKETNSRKMAFTNFFETNAEWFEVTRTFVSCLGLASTGNIEISNAKEQSTFDVKLTKNQENFTCKELIDIPATQIISKPVTCNSSEISSKTNSNRTDSTVSIPRTTGKGRKSQKTRINYSEFLEDE